ncbi:MAG: endo-1,4-beta-xylanase [Methanothermobacter tenebrarum]
MPDPRVTNPELFDLTNPNAPIPQFVNTLRNAGIEVAGEQVVEGITYQVLKDKDGNHFVVGVYNLDPNLFPAKYRDLAGSFAFFYYDGRGWSKDDINKKLSGIANFPLGVLLMPDVPDAIGITKNNFSVGVATYNILKITRDNVNTSSENYNFNWPDSQVRLAKQLGMRVRFHALVSRDRMPKGLENLTKEEFISFLERYFRGVFSHFEEKFPGVVYEYDILGEARPNEPGRDLYAAKFGEYYPRLIFETADRIRKEINPAIKIGYIDTNNLLPTSSATNVNKNLILPQIAPYIDYYGVQGHLYLDSDKLNANNLQAAINNLKDYQEIIGGKPILITEHDIRIINPLEQALVGQLLLSLSESTQVQSLTFWGIGDNYSWLGKDAKATPFDDNFNPKLWWYILNKFLLEESRMVQ